MSGEIGIDVEHAALLVRTLERAADDLDRSAAELWSLTELECGLDRAAREVRDTAEWCRRSADDVRRRVERISRRPQLLRERAIAAYVRPFGEKPREEAAIIDLYQRCASGAPCRQEVEEGLAEVDYDGLLHGLLDTAGLLPGVGEPADAWNAKLYWEEGARDDAVISAAAVVAGFGDLGKGGCLAKRRRKARRPWILRRVERTAHHPRFGTFYKDPVEALWWVKDRAGHGGSAWKLYEETKRGLTWVKDADEFGTFLAGKHKGAVGRFIPWKEFTGR